MVGGESAQKRWLPAGILLALALALRLVGIGHLLPYFPEPDVVFGVLLRGKTLNLEHYEHLESYPQLVPEIARLGRTLGPKLEAPATLEEALSAAAAPIRDCRIVVAVLAALCAPATFLCARRFLSVRVSFLAGLLAATSPLSMAYSAQARPHAALAGLVAVTLAAALALRRRPTWRAHLAAGAGLAASVGVLQSALSLVLPLAAAFLLREGPRSRRDWLRPLAACALSIPVVAHGFALPSARGPLAESVQPDEAVVWLGGHVVEIERFRGSGFATLFWTLWSYEFWLLVLLGCGAALGIAVLRRARPATWLRTTEGRDAIVLAAFALPYTFVFGMYDSSFERFFLPLAPVLCVLGAASACALAESLRPVGRLIAVGAPGLLVAAPCCVALKLAWLRARPDTLEVAATAVRASSSPAVDRVWIAPRMELPLLATPEALERNRSQIGPVELFFWTRYQIERPLEIPGEAPHDMTIVPWVGKVERGRLDAPAADELAAEHPGLVVAGRLGPGRGTHFLRTLQRALRERSPPDLRIRAVPWGDEGRALSYARHPRDDPPYWLDVLRAERVGPYVEITRLRPAESPGGAAHLDR
jgi:hypothetical protein